MLLNVIKNLLVDDDVDDIKEGAWNGGPKAITTMSIIIFMQSSLNSPTIEIFSLSRVSFEISGFLFLFCLYNCM